MDKQAQREALADRMVDIMIDEENHRKTENEGQHEINVIDMTRVIANAMRNYLIQIGIDEDQVTMQTISELLAQVLAGYISHTKAAENRDEYDKLIEIIKVTTLAYDSVYPQIKS